MKKSKEKHVADRNRTGRMFIDQERRMTILEENGFSYQKLFREGMELIIEEKMKFLSANKK